MINYSTNDLHQPPAPGTRLYIGLVIFTLSFFMLPTGLFLRHYFPPPFWSAFIVAVFWAGAPIMKVSSVAIMGKPTYLWIKYKIWHLFVKVTKPHVVSRTRYTIGLILFCLPVIPNYIMVYSPRLIADAFQWRLVVSIAVDFVFVISLFVLGGDFWDKLRALFSYTAKAKFIEKVPAPEAVSK